MKCKKLLALVMAAVLSVSMLTACGGGSGVKEMQKTFGFGHGSGAVGQYADRLWRRQRRKRYAEHHTGRKLGRSSRK